MKIHQQSNKGFTLIELLIVIALLGALAVGLLAALDPFEQLKKGTDTGVRNTVSEIQGAAIRYYAIKNYMPWCTTAACDANWRDGLTSEVLPNSPGKTADQMSETLDEISSTGELKTDFQTLGEGALPKITIFGQNTDPTIEVCYKPTAKSFINDPNTKYNADTGAEEAAGTCKGQGGADESCLWCIQ
jgi:prepilin-type N-terminal cleavage/methylation domain-containing protein